MGATLGATSHERAHGLELDDETVSIFDNKVTTPIMNINYMQNFSPGAHYFPLRTPYPSSLATALQISVSEINFGKCSRFANDITCTTPTCTLRHLRSRHVGARKCIPSYVITTLLQTSI